jgi:DNA anti-recombination protein RmuC
MKLNLLITEKKYLIFLVSLVLPSIVLANNLEKIYKDPLTLMFIVVIAGTTAFFQLKFDRYAVNHGPEILTTLGIFGCFTGIALALLDFDTKNINESVPQLLEGVKTAFWASVTGVLGALTIKFRHRFSKEPIQVSDGQPKSASLEDVVSAITTLRRSITGETDSSLISQIKLMRQELNDNSKELRKSLDDFAEKVSELGSKALIEALQKVISDFNNQLNEQFGENFKQLNLAVEKLVLWQQQYKEELDKLQTVQKQSSEDLSKSALIFSDLVSKAAAYTSSAESLSNLLKVFESQHTLLKESQEALSSVLLSMKEVEPSFSNKLLDLTTTFKDGTASITEHMQTQVKELGLQLKTKNDEMADVVKKMVPEIQKQVNDQILQSQKQLSQSFATLDENLEKELQKSLTTLGQQLTSLSEKFVKDYSPLTERLREIVNISKGV